MDFDKAVDFIWENSRLLERAVFEYRFCGGPAARVLDILRAYQNPDGGFGHALEPDLRAPDSYPLYVEFALGILRECGLRDPDMAGKACDFVARHADLKLGIPVLLPSYTRYPHARHWDSPYGTQASLDRLTGTVGLLYWQGIQRPWLNQAADACLEKIATIPFTDAHTILTAFSLLESLSAGRDVEPLFQKLAGELPSARFYCPTAPVTGYALTPLDFAPTPQAYPRRLFTQAQIAAHLDDLESQQDPDGGWPIQWDPPAGAARCEWRARKTLLALSVLRAYGRI